MIKAKEFRVPTAGKLSQEEVDELLKGLIESKIVHPDSTILESTNKWVRIIQP